RASQRATQRPLDAGGAGRLLADRAGSRATAGARWGDARRRPDGVHRPRTPRERAASGGPVPRGDARRVPGIDRRRGDPGVEGVSPARVGYAHLLIRRTATAALARRRASPAARRGQAPRGGDNCVLQERIAFLVRELEQTGEDPAGHLDVMTARPGGGGERLGTLTLPHPAPEMRDTVIRRGWPHRFSGPDRRFANRANWPLFVHYAPCCDFGRSRRPRISRRSSCGKHGLTT